MTWRCSFVPSSSSITNVSPQVTLEPISEHSVSNFSRVHISRNGQYPHQKSLEL